MVVQSLGAVVPIGHCELASPMPNASYVLGEVADFYEQLWRWDLLLHGSSAVVTGLIGFLAVYAFYVTNRIRIDPFYLAAISFGCAVTVGTLWEVFEYLMDLGLGLNMQRSGLTDTMTDLMVNGRRPVV